MAGAVFNLKKLLKYGKRPLKSIAKAMQIEQKGKESLKLILKAILGFNNDILSYPNSLKTSTV